MEEIKVGELVRTNKGLIDKVIDIKEAGSGIRYGGESFKDTIVVLNGDLLSETRVALTDIVKHSKNIKDLVEAGDVIKYKINSLRVELGKVEKYTDARSFEKYLAVNGCNLEEVDILEILTKEKFESECFKVEEGQDV